MSIRTAIFGGGVVAAIWAGSTLIDDRAKAFVGDVRSAAGEIIYVVDGDTVEVAGKRYRLTGFDAPEIFRVGCAAERQLGLTVAVRMIDIMRNGRVAFNRLGGRDKWGRGLARINVDGRDVGDLLIDEGLARRYDGRSRRGSWC